MASGRALRIGVGICACLNSTSSDIVATGRINEALSGNTTGWSSGGRSDPRSSSTPAAHASTGEHTTGYALNCTMSTRHLRHLLWTSELHLCSMSTRHLRDLWRRGSCVSRYRRRWSRRHRGLRRRRSLMTLPECGTWLMRSRKSTETVSPNRCCGLE